MNFKIRADLAVDCSGLGSMLESGSTRFKALEVSPRVDLRRHRCSKLGLVPRDEVGRLQELAVVLGQLV